MDTYDEYCSQNSLGIDCDTIFFQGNGCSQTQILKYVGDSKVIATTGETMWCTSQNIKVIYRPFIGNEITDISLKPFDSPSRFFNPVVLVNSAATKISNLANGFHVESIPDAEETVAYHCSNISEINIGQESDIHSHKSKHDAWFQNNKKTKDLILFGVSRGTAATFCAYAIYKYPQVKLVILEGAIDSVPEVIKNRAGLYFESEDACNFISQKINTTLTFLNNKNYIKFNPEGLSPLDCVDDFPENVPVVFISSKIDKTVPYKSTENIAQKLASRGKNEVFLISLNASSHPNYAFDCKEDREIYETTINAILKRFGFKHDPLLAEKGESKLDQFRLNSHSLQKLKF